MGMVGWVYRPNRVCGKISSCSQLEERRGWLCHHRSPSHCQESSHGLRYCNSVAPYLSRSLRATVFPLTRCGQIYDSTLPATICRESVSSHVCVEGHLGSSMAGVMQENPPPPGLLTGPRPQTSDRVEAALFEKPLRWFA